MAETLRARALKLLAGREHTRLELARKLSAHAETPAEVEAVLEECQRRGWLSESRAAEQLVHARRGRFGARRIERELRERGLAEEAVSAAMCGLKEGEEQRARAVWQRKYKGPPANARERARQVRFLQGRGFELDMIFKVIGEKRDD